MTRKMAREEAFILIFEKVFSKESVEDVLETALEARDLVPDEYIKAVFSGVYERVEELDGIISDKAVGWKLDRISKTALSILRLAIFEIKYMEDIPLSVSINEAVEIAKKYATGEDASFINGILSSVAKEI